MTLNKGFLSSGAEPRSYGSTVVLYTDCKQASSLTRLSEPLYLEICECTKIVIINPSLHRKTAYMTMISAVGKNCPRKSVCKL